MNRVERLAKQARAMAERYANCLGHRPVRGVLGDLYCARCDNPLPEEDDE